MDKEKKISALTETEQIKKWSNEINNYIKNNKIAIPNTIVLDNGICTISPTNKKSFQYVEISCIFFKQERIIRVITA